MKCYHCFTEKPFFATVCHACNHETTFTMQIMCAVFGFIASVVTIVGVFALAIFLLEMFYG